jgi:hypothetical protein
MAKKVYITENQFNRLVESQNKKHNKPNRDINMDCVKASRKKRREEDRDIYGDGFKQTTRVTKTEKAYSRKRKNKFNGNYFDDED